MRAEAEPMKNRNRTDEPIPNPTYTRELLKEWCGQIAVDKLDNRLLSGLLLMNIEI